MCLLGKKQLSWGESCVDKFDILSIFNCQKEKVVSSSNRFKIAWAQWVCIIIIIFFFLWPHLWHMEVPMLGVKLELWLSAYAIARATLDPSCNCDLCCSLWQCQILNSLSQARGQNCILIVIIGSLTHWAIMGTSCAIFIHVSLVFSAEILVSSRWMDEWRNEALAIFSRM